MTRFRAVRTAGLAACCMSLSACIVHMPETPGPEPMHGAAPAGLPEKHVVPPTTAPNALLSPGLMVGNTLYVSGNSGNDPATRALATGGVGPETRQTIANSRATLQAAGMDLKDVVSVTVYLTDAADFQAFNAVYRELFTTDPRPTRTTVVVKQLVTAGAHIEITMTAVKTR